MRDFSSLEKAPALEDFGLVQGSRQTPEQLLPVLRNPTVRRVAALFGSDAEVRQLDRAALGDHDVAVQRIGRKETSGVARRKRDPVGDNRRVREA